MGERGRNTKHLIPGRLNPPEFLAKKLIPYWDNIVDSVKEGHFVLADAHLIASYCQALLIEETNLKLLKRHGPVDSKGKVSAYYKLYQASVRSTTDLATKLRLSPASRSATYRGAKPPPVDGGEDRDGLI